MSELRKERYPILFVSQDVIQGEGFLARVEVTGRGLLYREEGGGWWVEGVNPGGFVATGHTARFALAAFRRAYSAILFDLVEESASFAEFDRQLGEFFAGPPGNKLETEWREAVRDVRRGRIRADWLARRSADDAPGIEVTLLDSPPGARRRPPEGAALAA